MPLVGRSIVIDANGRAKARAAVGAARNHHIRAVTVAGRSHTGQHIDVVIRRAPGAVNCQKDLAREAAWIDRPASEATAEVHCRNLVKRRRLVSNLRIRRADTPKATSAISAANEEIAITGHVERSPTCGVRQTERSLPCDTGVSGAVEQPTAACRSRAPRLVLESVSWAVGSVDCEPLLVAAPCCSVGLQFCPILAAIG